VNDPVRARELVELGVTGIITDDPGLMSTSLRGE
jgi:glycerophosphoryl diester phosphodiesterase